MVRPRARRRNHALRAVPSAGQVRAAGLGRYDGLTPLLRASDNVRYVDERCADAYALVARARRTRPIFSCAINSLPPRPRTVATLPSRMACASCTGQMPSWEAAAGGLSGAGTCD